jgi:two-component system OmpR family sensor kinase
MRRALARGVLALVPLAGSMLASALLSRSALPNYVLAGRYEVDLVWITSTLGIAVSVILLGVLSLAWWVEQTTAPRVRAEERAAQATAWQRFVRRLDHELKNPLTIIRLGITNLQHGPNLMPEQTASLERIGLQADRLQKLVIDLRSLVELEEQGLDKTSIDLREVIAEAVDLSTHAWRNRKVEVRIQEVPWPVETLTGDRDLLGLALRNLLDNALKFTGPDGQVEVRVSEDGRMAVIEIADDGIGIPAGTVEHVFEELYRGENAQSTPGSGLGLALVQKIVALHGGTIAIRSREGQGTLVTIRLPLARAS